MAYTGTLPPKVPRDVGVLPATRLSAKTGAGERSAPDPGAIPFFLILIFTFFLLGRPQDFIKSMRYIKFAYFFGGTAILTWLLGVFSKQIKFLRSTELFLMLGLTGWFLAGVPFAYLRSSALQNIGNEWIKILMVFLVLSQTVTSTKRLRLLLWVMLLSGLLATGGSLAQGSDLPANIEGRFMGLSRGFFWGNYLGIAASVLTPFIVVMLMNTRSIVKQLILIATFFSMLIMLVLTSSRSNVINILISLVLVWAIVLRDNLKAKMVGIIVACVLPMGLAFAPDAFWERVGTLWGSEASVGTETAKVAEASSQQRKDLLLHSIQVTFERPIFGLGVGNFMYYSGDKWWVVMGTHNTFTQVSSEAGIPALILFLMIQMTGLIRMRRMVRMCKGRADLVEERALASATIVSILCFMVGACFAHLAWEFYVYYLSVIGVALQTIYTRATGGSLELPKLGSGKRKGKGSGWLHLSRTENEATS